MADWLTTARKHLRDADPALGAIIDHRPDFDPRAWLRQLLPSMDAFGALLFQVVGQQLSVSSARAIMARLQAAFGGHLPGPRELLDAGPQQLREEYEQGNVHQGQAGVTPLSAATIHR